MSDPTSTKQQPGQPYDFSKAHLHIALPCYGGMMYESTTSALIRFILLAQQVGLSWSLDTLCNESLIPRGRNCLVAKMLTNPDATHMMFLDSDIAFDPESILHMMAADKEIIAGAYPKKSLPIAYNINLEQKTKVQGPLFTVDTAATGFLMFKREVITKMITAMPDTKFKDDIGLGKQYEPNLYALFDCYIDHNGHYLSEDWAFCRRAKNIGYDIWLDTRVKLTHTGTYKFEGDLSKLPNFNSIAQTVVPQAIITETK